MRHNFEAFREKPEQGEYTKLRFSPNYDSFAVYVPTPHPQTRPHDRLVQSILEVILEQYPIKDSCIDDNKIKVRIPGTMGANAATDVPQMKEIRKALSTAGYKC